MAYKNTIAAVPYGSLASSSVTSSYQLVQTLPNACFLLRINNFTSQILIISYDGVTDHDQVDTRTSLNVYGGNAGSSPQTSTCLWPIGTQVWIRGTAGTGAVTVAGYYQPVLGGE